MITRNLRGVIVCALLATSAIVSPANAQNAAFLNTEREAPDENGVDVISGKLSLPIQGVTVGRADQGGLTYSLGYSGGVFFNTFAVSLTAFSSAIGGQTGVTVFGQSERFTLNSDGTYAAMNANGSQLSFNSASATYTYVLSDGTTFTFLKSLGDSGYGASVTARASSIKLPSGETRTYTWSIYQGAPACLNLSCGPTFPGARVESVTNNLGYQLKPAYESDTFQRPGGNNAAWNNLISVTAINNTVDYCAPVGACVGLTQIWPKVTISKTVNSSTTTTNYTNNTNRTTSVNSSSTGPLSLQLPASTTPDRSVTYDANNRVATVAVGGGTWNYAYADSSNQRTTSVTQPLGGMKSYVSDTTLKRILSSTDELGRTTSFVYDSSGRLLQKTLPEGNAIAYTYDGRGNPLTARRIAKAGSGLSDVLTSGSYPTSCDNVVTCNQPTSTTDARGNTTSYSYDGTHGGAISITSPAPSAGGTQPQVRYSYSALSAFYKNSSGIITQAASPVYKLTGLSACQSSAACAGTADEATATISYGNVGVANNLLPIAVAKGSGDGLLTATTTAAYDSAGNIISVDGPLPGNADTTTYFYDPNRQLTMIASPDPDGAGPRPSRATRYNYDLNGLIASADEGTITNSGGTWSAISVTDSLLLARDNLGRIVSKSLASGPVGSQVVQAFEQSSYDAKGRPECVATRMNGASFSSPPASACTLGASGSYGSDLITKNLYDAADEITQVRVGYGTADEAAERTLAYTNNGKLASLTDGETNKTTYVYDGFDRLAQTQYPSSTKGAGTSNANDFEQLTYDASGNVTSRRLRDATSIGYTVDALNRVTLKSLPGSEPAVSYVYDNLGRLTSASQPGNAQSFTYDALGRNLTQVSPQGTIASSWDLAGNRLQLTYPGSGLAVNYDYLVTGEMAHIRENGATSGVGVLATFNYDDLGRRTTLTRGNGTVTSYTFDPVSRLASLNEQMAGTANNQNVTFSYSPASQIASLSKSNDLYAWTGHGSGTTSSSSNGLNQLATIGGSSPNYDARGNLISDPTTGKTFGYSSENLLTSGAGGVTLTYDPLMRLGQIASTATTRFGYDGSRLIAEYNGSNSLLRRYVHGPSTDEPLVQYEGSGLTDRRFMHADERGSVIAISDGSGNALTTNRYDEYGKPQSTNAGRFQYTGQTWLSELGLYYYKARMYAPALGRFMQTDPIGAAGGINIYAYVGNDAVNGVDPSGLAVSCGSGSVLIVDKPGSVSYGLDGSQTVTANSGYCYTLPNDFGAVGGNPIIYGGPILKNAPAIPSPRETQPAKPCSSGSSSLPANYPVPSGSTPYTPDGRMIRTANGALRINPAYQAQINSFRPNTRGILADFYNIAKGIVTSFAIGGAESEIGDLIGLSRGQKSAVDVAQGLKDSKDAAKDTQEELNKCH